MELISQGIGNVASVFFGGFSATGAIARTATNIRAGAMSSISAIVHSLFLVAVVMWLLPLIELIPLAALASVLVIVAYDMSDLRTVRHIFQVPKSDWSVMLLAFALTVVFDLTVAVYTGVILESLLFMRRMGELTGLHTCVSREDEASGHEIPIPDKNNVPDGVEVFAINGPLFFGVADRFQSTLNAMETPPKVFIMYLHNMSTIDMTGIHASLSAGGKAVACYSPPCGNPSTGRSSGSVSCAPWAKRTSSLTRRSAAPRRGNFGRYHYRPGKEFCYG